ncbi:hypothetical protein [Bifidobacterium animalis]|uniref:hypothetical protein n=1 Tax=Bifidobacterium animalis TaxID=28025 RepID=UPI000A4E728C|nr:hypothetical protein [Bifidobacterium animalis]
MAKPPDPVQTTKTLFDRPIGKLSDSELGQAMGLLRSMGLDAIADALAYNKSRNVQELINLYNRGNLAQIQQKPEHTPQRRKIVRTTAPAADKTTANHAATQEQPTRVWEPVAPDTHYEAGQILDTMPEFVQRDTSTPYERIAAQCQTNPGKPVIMRTVTGDNPRKNLDLAQRTALRVNRRASQIWRPESGQYTAIAGIPVLQPSIAIVVLRYDTTTEDGEHADQ